MNPDSAQLTRQWRIIVAGISALILTVGVARFAYTPLLPLMRSEAGLSAFAAGGLATINYAGYIAGAVIASALSRIEAKFLIYRWGLVLAVLTTAGTGLTTNIYLWAALRFISGFASTSGMLLASGLILHWLIRHKQRPQLGPHFIGMGAGIALSGFCAALMATWLTWDQQWLCFSGIGLFFFFPAWLWMPKPGGPLTKKEAGFVVRPARKWMIPLHASYFCAGFGYVVSATFLVATVDRVPALMAFGNWVWVIVGLAAIPSSFLWDWLANRIGVVPALIGAYLLQIVSILLPALSGSISANIVGAAFYGGTFAGIVSLTLALVGRYFPQNPAKAMARLTLSYGVALIAAPALAGFLAKASGDYRSALLLAAGVMAAGTFLLSLLGRATAVSANAVPTYGMQTASGSRK